MMWCETAAQLQKQGSSWLGKERKTMEGRRRQRRGEVEDRTYPVCWSLPINFWERILLTGHSEIQRSSSQLFFQSRRLTGLRQMRVYSHVGPTNGLGQLRCYLNSRHRSTH